MGGTAILPLDGSAGRGRAATLGLSISRGRATVAAPCATADDCCCCCCCLFSFFTSAPNLLSSSLISFFDSFGCGGNPNPNAACISLCSACNCFICISSCFFCFCCSFLICVCWMCCSCCSCIICNCFCISCFLGSPGGKLFARARIASISLFNLCISAKKPDGFSRLTPAPGPWGLTGKAVAAVAVEAVDASPCPVLSPFAPPICWL